jgi:phospholipase C
MDWANLVVAAITALFNLLSSGQSGARSSSAQTPSSYDHIIIVVEENHSFEEIIGNPAAPTINQLAGSYGLATNYFAVSHPSEPDYVALLGGDTFGIADDDRYYKHTIGDASLVDQLEAAGLSWGGYFQSLPYAGFTGVCTPKDCDKLPSVDELYASKHNPFMNFARIQSNQAELARIVPDTQFAADVQSGGLPNFSFVVPDQCNDMHGSPSNCGDSGKPRSPSDNRLVARADAYVATLVSQVMNSALWSSGRNAIVLVWDEGDDNRGCCGSSNGGGRVPAIVITNAGARTVRDNAPYNHYSLLQTIERAFGLGCLRIACDTSRISPMIPLFWPQ